MKLKPSLFPAILFLAALAIQLLPGCAPSPERCRLEQIESIIDEHPDSAMTVLDSIDTAALRSDRDRALYDLLYNLALYKSFNDSLDEHALKHAVDVFSDCGETSHAIRSNYLLGNMYRLSDKIIPAVVTLSQGLELASQSGDRFNEGLCALSLYELYGKAYDSKRQIKYSRQAAEAFREAGKTDWELYALLYLSSGFINTEQYDSALIVSADILNNKSVYSDSSIMAMASDVMAMSASKTGNIPLAVKSYANAIRYDKGALSNGIFNIMSLLEFKDISDANSEDVNILREYVSTDTSAIPFHVYAKYGKFQKAYEGLNRYRLEQDEFIQKMFCRTVDYAIDNYRIQQTEMLESKVNGLYKKRVYFGVITVMAAVILLLWIRYRMKKHQYEYQRTLLEVSLLTKALEESTNKSKQLSENIRAITASKASLIDRLCSSYYKANNKKIVSEVKNIIADLSSSPEAVTEIEKYLNQNSENILSRFRKEFPDLTSKDYLLFTYSVMNFSTSTIAILMNEKKEAIYNRRFRLKSRIKISDSISKEEFQSYLE